MTHVHDFDVQWPDEVRCDCGARQLPFNEVAEETYLQGYHDGYDAGRNGGPDPIWIRGHRILEREAANRAKGYRPIDATV